MAEFPQKKVSNVKLKMLRKEFDSMDKDGDGKITAAELATSMRECGKEPDTKEIEDLIQVADTNGDKEIDFDEFLHMMASDEENEDDEMLRELFDVYDKDGNGFVSLDELKSVLEQQGLKLNAKAVKEFRQMDPRGDGHITFQDFKKMVDA